MSPRLSALLPGLLPAAALHVAESISGNASRNLFARDSLQPTGSGLDLAPECGG